MSARTGSAVAATLATLLLLAACSQKTAPQTVAPAGFTAVRDADSGFAIAYPSEWIRIPLSDNLDEFDEKSRDLIATNVNLLPAINQARQIAQYGGKLMAVSPDGNTRINLTVDKAKEKNLEEVAKAVIPLLQEGGAQAVQQEQSRTGAGAALKLTFIYPLPGRGNETVPANEVQYYVIHEGKSFVITLINSTPEIAQSVADSFRLN